MEKKRAFRQNYTPLNKNYKFNIGDVATIVNEEIPNIKIKINERAYLLPYRDFIVLTKKIE